MSDNQRQMVLHAIGGRPLRGRKPWRNHYCADAGSSADLEWAHLVALGLATEGRPINEGRTRCYHVTPAGIKAVEEVNERKSAHV